MDPKDTLKNNSIVQIKTPLEIEYENYIEMPVKNIQNPLKFWFEHKSKFKLLAAIAKMIFAIPASSTEPERHCSSAGLTLTKLRNRQTPEHFEATVLCNEHLKNLFKEK